MKKLRRIALGINFISIICLMMLFVYFHFLAPNPTQRWFSSDVLDITSTTSDERGVQGEYLLAADLGLSQPTNERSNQATCVCNSRYQGNTIPNQCSVCAVYTSEVSNYRIPDFVTESYIAEAKNRRDLSQNSNELREQLEEMAAASEALGLPFYIFVRVNTNVDNFYYDLSQATGGNVIQYFLVDGYENHLMFEQAINHILIVMLIIGAVLFVWELIASNRPSSPHDESANDVIDKAESKVDETEEFIKRLERLSKDKDSKSNDEKKGKP